MVFDGASNRIELYKGAPTGTALPTKELTIEVWAKIETRASWTGILNYVQDNGSYERGFFLGVVDGRIGGYIATVREGGSPRYDWISWDDYFELGRWYHIAFTYDGANMKLYIDEALVRESSQAYGDIAYPEQSTFAIGAFMDDNELEHIKGAIREVRLYGRALSSDEIKASAPGQIEASPTGGAQGTAGVIVVLKDGTTLSGILIRVEGEEIIVSQGTAGLARIKFDNILAVLPLGK